MTAIHPMGSRYHNLTNQFKQTHGDREINFRNETSRRDNVSSIEIRTSDRITHAFTVDTEDNVAMALAILGVGRVTDEVEQVATEAMDGKTTDELIRFAVVNLRAALILKEQEAATSAKELDEAYALYSLAYPKTDVTREEFPIQSLSSFWVGNLRTIRKDPTVLGSL